MDTIPVAAQASPLAPPPQVNGGSHVIQNVVGPATATLIPAKIVHVSHTSTSTAGHVLHNQHIPLATCRLVPQSVNAPQNPHVSVVTSSMVPRGSNGPPILTIRTTTVPQSPRGPRKGTNLPQNATSAGINRLPLPPQVNSK